MLKTRTIIALVLASFILQCLPITSQAQVHIDNPTLQDNSRIADRAFLEAEGLRTQKTRESLRKAIEKYEEALRLRRIAQDRTGEAASLSRIGLVYLYLGEKKKALEKFNEAILIYRELDDSRGEAENLTNMGSAYYLMGDSREAVEYFQKALPIWQDIGDKQALAQTLKNTGATYYKLSNRNAIAFSVEARELSRLIGDKQGELDALATIEKVFDENRRQITIARTRNDKSAEVGAVLNLCNSYSLSGQKYKAIQCYNSVIPYYKSILGDYYAAGLLQTVGLELTWLGEYQQALDYHNQALKAFGGKGKAIQLTNTGYIYSLIGDMQKAIDCYNQSLKISRDTAGGSNKYSEALTLTAIGFAYFSMGDVQKALEYYSQALPITQAIKRPREEGMTLGAIGLAYNALGERQKALDFLTQGLNRIRFAKNLFGGRERFFESIALTNIGLVYNSLGQKQRALDYYRQARLVSQLAVDARGEAAALYGMASIERERGNLVEARNLIETAIKNIELVRSRIPGHELRASFFASVRNYYEMYIDLLMQLHKSQPSDGFDFLALQASERARARSLLELFNELQMNIRQGVDRDLLKREQELQQQLSSKAVTELRLLTGQDDAGNAARLKKEIEALTNAYQEVQTQIRAKNKRYAELIQPQPLTIKEIQQQVLDADTLLLEYALGEERSYLWAVTKSSITSYELPGRARIEALAKQFYQLLIEPNQVYQATADNRGMRLKKVDARDKRVVDVSSVLSEMLLGPVAPQLEQKRLLVITEGALQYIPFTALPEPDSTKQDSSNRQPLVMNHEIISLPSLSSIDVLRKELVVRKPASKALAVLADPVFNKYDERVRARISQKPDKNSDDISEERGLIIKVQSSANESGITDATSPILRLPGTRQEAERILDLVPQEDRLKALDFAASRTTATSPDLSNYRIIHFATHGIANSTHPELSGILLSMVDEQGSSQNGFLQAHEVYNLRLPADIVVLSACQTALGKDIKGEGLIGLTRGFMYSGAARVIASLWRVDDDATSDLIVRFYTGLLKDGLKPAAALRAAQISMWKDKKWEAPYYWAAFVIQGEWR